MHLPRSLYVSAFLSFSILAHLYRKFCAKSYLSIIKATLEASCRTARSSIQSGSSLARLVKSRASLNKRSFVIFLDYSTIILSNSARCPTNFLSSILRKFRVSRLLPLLLLKKFVIIMSRSGSTSSLYFSAFFFFFRINFILSIYDISGGIKSDILCYI